MLRRDYPYTLRWLLHLDDLSGLDGEWDATPAPVVEQLLDVIGAVYLPFLHANAAALAAGAETLHFEALDHPYEQGTFKYQARCLADLRSRFAALSQADRAGIEPLLARTGCLAGLTE